MPGISSNMQTNHNQSSCGSGVVFRRGGSVATVVLNRTTPKSNQPCNLLFKYCCPGGRRPLIY